MRRVLFAAIVLVLLFGSFSTAFAAEPQQIDDVTLGEVWWFYFNFPTLAPGSRVDAYLYRPSTLFGWPTVDFWGNPWPTVGPAYGTWFKDEPMSQQRRMSYAEDWLYTDVWGWYYAEFMMPRDEVWFPCSFPFKWKCNYVIDPWTIEYHSPVDLDAEPGMYWPWLDFSILADPQDTVSPLEVLLIGEDGFTYNIPFEVVGYYWKWTDIN
jgi:hypothetical protein